MIRRILVLKIVLAVGLVSGLTTLPSAFAQSRNYLPLKKADLGKPFALKRIATFTREQRISLPTAVGPMGARFEAPHDPEEGPLRLAGIDTKGRPWSVDLFRVIGCIWSYGIPLSVFEADLDRNGTLDAVVMMPTCGNGLAPTVHLIAILFDQAGRPVPLEAEGYFEELRTGVDMLVDMDGDGRAELVFMNFDDGYWITNVYAARDGHWHRVSGRFGRRVFPLFTRFTRRPNRRAVTPTAGRHPFAPDLSNDRPVFEGFLRDWKWPDRSRPIQDRSELNLSLTLEDEHGHATQCAPDYWHGSSRLILDAAIGRQILRLDSNDRARVDPVLSDIRSKKYRVALSGRRAPDRCSPELLWARSD